MTRSIEELLDLEPVFWQYENEGDQCAGEVIEVSEMEGKFGPYQVVTVLDGNGKAWAIHASPSVLSNEISARNPQPGDNLGVRYLGKRVPKSGGAPYHSFRVICQASGPRPAHAPVEREATTWSSDEEVPLDPASELASHTDRKNLYDRLQALGSDGWRAWKAAGLGRVSELPAGDLDKARQLVTGVEDETEPF